MTEYALKLDSYYFDIKRNTTIVIIKVRNKRIMNSLTLNEIFSDKNALHNLHPIDLCILGIIANSSNQGTSRARILDSFSMAVIKPILEISKREFNEGNEILTLNLRHLNSSIKISANDLYHNEDLMNALNYQDAIAVGHAVSDSPSFIEEKITVPHEEYTLMPLFLQASFIALLILSALMCGKIITLNVFNVLVDFRAEILSLPLIFLIQNKIYRVHGFKIANAFILCGFASYMVFLVYYGVIVSLPYPQTNSNSVVYNNLYASLLENEFNYIMSLFTACLAYSYIYKYYIESGVSLISKNNVSLYIISVIYFSAAVIITITLGRSGYSLCEITYTTMAIMLFTSINYLATIGEVARKFRFSLPKYW